MKHGWLVVYFLVMGIASVVLSECGINYDNAYFWLFDGSLCLTYISGFMNGRNSL